MKESVRANLRRLVKRILRNYGYPPDKQAKAAETVLEQAEVLCGKLGVSKKGSLLNIHDVSKFREEILHFDELIAIRVIQRRFDTPLSLECRRIASRLLPLA